VETGFPVNVRVSVAPSYSALAAVAVEVCAPTAVTVPLVIFAGTRCKTTLPVCTAVRSIEHSSHSCPVARGGCVLPPCHKIDRQHISSTRIDVSIRRHHTHASLSHTIEMLHLFPEANVAFMVCAAKLVACDGCPSTVFCEVNVARRWPPLLQLRRTTWPSRFSGSAERASNAVPNGSSSMCDAAHLCLRRPAAGSLRHVQRHQVRVTVPVKVDHRVAPTAHRLLRRLVLRQLHSHQKNAPVAVDYRRRDPLASTKIGCRCVSRSNLYRTLRVHPFGGAIHSQNTVAVPALPCLSPWVAGKISRLHHVHLGSSRS